MNQITTLLLLNRSIEKLYDRHMDSVRTRYELSRIEITIISFLHNNPGLDTAGHIAELRLLSKGNVSQGVESLIQKGFLSRSPDKADRRKIHLTLTEQSAPILLQIDETKANFHRLLTKELTQEEISQYERLISKLLKNLQKEVSSL